MRMYQIETKQKKNGWKLLPKKYDNCAAAHRMLRHLQATTSTPHRVCMKMVPSKLKLRTTNEK